MHDMDWLFASASQQHLQSTVTALEQSQPILAIAKRLRRELTPAQAASVIELAQLRIKGRTKFSRSDSLFLTRKGLEQATSERLAIYKADCFPPNQLVVDVCVGIGGDAIGLARRGPLVAIDKDPVHSRFAAANLTAYDCPDANVINADFRDWSLPENCAVHFDPDRRDQQRTIMPSMFQPPISEITARIGERLTAIKLAPASRLPSELLSQCHREWIGDQRECKQQLVWFHHPQRARGQRSATVLFNDGQQVTLVGEQGIPEYLPVAEKIASFIIEPHAAVIAAGLTDDLAWRSAGRRLASDVAYITSDIFPDTRLAQTFAVLAVRPLQLKAIEQTLNDLGLGTIEWKKRGIEAQTWEDLQRLKLVGDQPGVVLLTRWRDKPIAIIATRPHTTNHSLDKQVLE
jgi:hypothetical protein